MKSIEVEHSALSVTFGLDLSDNTTKNHIEQNLLAEKVQNFRNVGRVGERNFLDHDAFQVLVISAPIDIVAVVLVGQNGAE